jgi:hypothetical protein
MVGTYNTRAINNKSYIEPKGNRLGSLCLHVKMDHTEILCEGVVQIYLAENTVQKRGLMNTIMNLVIP